MKMSRLNKAEEIIELAMMFQNSYCVLTIFKNILNVHAGQRKE